MKRAKRIPIILIISLLILAAVFYAAIYGLRAAETARQEKAAETLSESIKRAALSCYSIEGSYPDTLDYLADNYGVYIDHEKYAVYYEVFASNLMPDITVLKR